MLNYHEYIIDVLIDLCMFIMLNTAIGSLLRPFQQSRIPHIKVSCHNKHGIREQVTVNTLKLINRRMFGNWNINDYLHALGK